MAVAILLCGGFNHAHAALCAAPGKDGTTQNLNTYYPTTAAGATSGNTSVTIGTARTGAGTSSTPLTVGDLVLIIQMQDATINNADTIAYGDGSTGHGSTSLGNSGLYEFKVVQAVAGSVVTFTTALTNTYTNAAATTTQGARSFQIIRVPQFSNLTLPGGTLTTAAWDGSTGGVYILDVTGTLNLNSTIVDVSGLGFRGGGSFTENALSGSGIVDYATAFVGVAANDHGAFKGEGIAGTPRYVRSATVTNGVDGVDLGTSGYPNSLDLCRGGPGNAGGGGTQHNGGGGGGGNVGTGGIGGLTYATYSATNTGGCLALTSGVTTYYACGGDGARAMGGLGGVGQAASSTRLYLGGGAGAGDTNNASDSTADGQSSGGAGGGIIFIRAGSISGTGTLKANGTNGQPAGRDGAGGGGAGGTIIIAANPGSYGITASAQGGAGGSSGLNASDANLKGGETEGPGGGGGGGAVILATGVSITSQNISAGAAAVNTPVTGISNTYGSASGAGGTASFPLGAINPPLGASCLPSLTVTKTANPTSIINTSTGTTGNYTITISNAANLGAAVNVNATDTLPSGFTYTSGATVVFSGSAAGTTPPTNSGSSTVPSFNSFTIPGGGSAAITFPVTIASTVLGVIPNTGNAVYADPQRTTAGATLSVASSPVNVTVYAQPYGYVYADVNHNNDLDTSESGTGISGLFVKVASSVSGVCQSPATAAVAVDATTGLYSLPSVAAGTYCLILNSNNTLSNITPAIPSGWIGTQNSSGTIQVTIGSANIPPQNFGLFHGSTLSGKVFLDTGGGTNSNANNGTYDSNESGIANVTVSASGTGGPFTGTTSGTGDWTIWVPSTAGSSVAITEILPANDIASGAQVGTTSGTYVRSTNTTTFTYASGQSYTGINFGNVPVPIFTTDGTQNGIPGSIVYYPHTFTAPSTGSVTFSTSATASPNVAGWSEVLYLDSNCSGKYDAGEPQITSAIATTPGQTICVIVKEFIPTTAPFDGTNVIKVNAVYSYTGASPALSQTVTHTDLTTVTKASDLTLNKQVRNVTTATSFGTANTASPGDTLEYQLTGVNVGSNALTSVVISDSTPAYTLYVSASCPGSLPTNFTACNVSTHPAVGGQGAVQFTFTGSLASGSTVVVTYQVKVSQ